MADKTKEWKLRYLQADVMGCIFGWFAPLWWEAATKNYAREQLARTAAWFSEKHVGAIKFFSWWYGLRLDDPGNAYVHKCCPFPRAKKAGEPFILKTVRPKYLRMLEDALEILKDAGNRALQVGFMPRYSDIVFRNNVNGVAGFMDERGWPYQIDFINACLDVERRVYGEIAAGYCPENEIAHGGNHRMLHKVADWARTIYSESNMANMVKMVKLYMDITDSEAAKAPFSGQDRCPYYNGSPTEYCNGTIGSDFFLGPYKRREVQTINHGYSIPENIGTDVDVYFGSAWGAPSVWWLGGDAGAGAEKEKAEGTALYSPGDQPAKIWAQGSPSQTGHLLRHVMKKGALKNKPVGYQMTFFRTLQGYPEGCEPAAAVRKFKVGDEVRTWPLAECFQREVFTKTEEAKRLNKAINAHVAAYGDAGWERWEPMK